MNITLNHQWAQVQLQHPQLANLNWEKHFDFKEAYNLKDLYPLQACWNPVNNNNNFAESFSLYDLKGNSIIESADIETFTQTLLKNL